MRVFLHQPRLLGVRSPMKQIKLFVPSDGHVTESLAECNEFMRTVDVVSVSVKPLFERRIPCFVVVYDVVDPRPSQGGTP